MRRPWRARHSTAEWTVTAILARQKCLPFFADRKRQGNWGSRRNNIDHPSPTKIKNPPAPMNEVADATVLIVGYGSIGQAIEARRAPFGAKFLRVGPSAHDGVEPVSNLDRVLAFGDIVVLAIPLTSEARRLTCSGGQREVYGSCFSADPRAGGEVCARRATDQWGDRENIDCRVQNLFETI